MSDFRIEKDSMGEIKVSSDKKWKAQTQRSLENFKIGTEKMPLDLIYALVQIKRAAALVNVEKGLFSQEKADLINDVCEEILSGKYDEQFPLVVWQTGSGTQSNMNVNEVISFLANEKAGKNIIHPNDDVNKGQSSNDTFPSAMHVSTALALVYQLIPSLELFYDTLFDLSAKYQGIVKIGRTHLQDATPLTLGQEISAWAYMIQQNIQMIESSLAYLYPLAIGGTAVGTGLNTSPDFGDKVALILKEKTDLNFSSSKNKFHALSSKDAMVNAHGALKALAANLLKIANDVRFLASGPRSGLGEISIPENEPGSSIMPGKVNPTQAESLTMVCAQVMGNDATIGFSASQGNFELNVYMPVIAYNMLQSIRLLSDAVKSFNDNCAIGIKPNLDKIQSNLEQSLMLVTALNPHIGYENAAKMAKYAYQNNLNLKQAAKDLNLVSEEDFDQWVKAENMV